MIIRGRGHPNITAIHPTTLAFTRDDEITLRGDCFVAVGCGWELGERFLESLKKSLRVSVSMECLGKKDVVTGRGAPALSPSGRDLVIRTSGWVGPRTLMVGADKPAKGLSRELVRALRTGAPVKITLSFPKHRFVNKPL